MVFQPQEARQAITKKNMWTKSIQANLVLLSVAVGYLAMWSFWNLHSAVK